MCFMEEAFGFDSPNYGDSRKNINPSGSDDALRAVEKNP